MSEKNKLSSKYQKLTDEQHVLQRSGMYIGSKKPNIDTKWIISDDNKMIQKEMTHIPGFIKLFDEIITNSIDESKREGSKLNTIKVTFDGDEIIVWDNGGIPVVMHDEYGEYIPQMIFSHLKAGSNFNDDEQRSWAGTNGVGSTLVNIFSTEFKVVTADGKNQFTQVFKNNMSESSKPIIKPSTKNFTEISWITDFKQFDMDGIDSDHLQMLEKRVYDLAGTTPGVKIYLNGKLINFKSFDDYVKLYTDTYIMEHNNDKSWSVAIGPADNGFNQVSFVNATETYDGGAHVDYILKQIYDPIRAHIKKKYKVEIKPSEIKNHVSLYINATVNNPHFSSQTKEKMITEVKDFGYTYDVSPKMISWILKSEIVERIGDWLDKKKDADDAKLARETNKALSKAKIDKLVDAKSKDRSNCMLFLFEGDSAAGNARDHRDAQTQGIFALRGKFINVHKITVKKMMENAEAFGLMGSIGLKVGVKARMEDLRYTKIVITTDADYDGFSITGQLINFFFKYWPELFEMGVIVKSETPIVIVTDKKTNVKINFFKQELFKDWMSENKANASKYDISYKKGLAALEFDEYKEIINNPILTQITLDDASKNSLATWFGDDADLRKVAIME